MKLNLKNRDVFVSEIKKWIKRGRIGGFEGLANILGVSRRVASEKYQQLGNGSLKVHGNTKNTPCNKVSDKVNKGIVNLYVADCKELSKRFGNNNHRPTIKSFKANHEIELSVEHIRKSLIKEGIFSCRTTRVGRKQIRESIKLKQHGNNDSEINKELREKFEAINNFKPLLGKVGHSGLSVEIDACEDFWINSEKQHIYFAIDSFSNKLLAMWIEKEETTIGYLNLLEALFRNYGAPNEIKADRRKSFWGTNHTMTHIGKILKSLGVTLSTNSSPTFKPNVERAFQNAQNNFPYFFYNKSWRKVEEIRANCLEIINHYNYSYRYELSNKSSFKTLENNVIKQSVCLTETRKVMNGNFINWNGKELAPFIDGKRQVMKVHSTIEVRTNISGLNFIIWNDAQVFLKEINGAYLSLIFSTHERQMMINKKRNQAVFRVLESKVNKINCEIRKRQKMGLDIQEIQL